jgi:HlyD family secretion protein
VGASGRRTWLWLLGLLVVAAVGTGVYALRWLREPALPRGFASGNGRIEATAYDVATKRPGRIAEVRVHEGDMVEKGQVLARIDTADLEAARREAEAQLQQAHESEHLALAQVAQRASERKLAHSELSRTQSLVDEKVASEQSLDRDRARSETAEAAARAAQEQVHQAKAAIAAATAAVERIQTDIDDSTIQSPVQGRVLYRLAEPGEVLGAGGKILTVLELTDVFMVIFLPTAEAGRVSLGSEARVVLDAVPEYVFPAAVSFVAPEAQFTPKEVETRTEREKLMFRVKVKIDPELLERYLSLVKSGVPGMAYVKIDGALAWPARLQVRLPE